MGERPWWKRDGRGSLLSIADLEILIVDVLACAWAYLGGEIDAMPALAFGSGAVSFLVLAAVGWKGAALGKVGNVAKAL